VKLVTDINEINEEFALTIGNFDGVHLGHQQLISELIEKGKSHSLKSAVITFRPHPTEILFPERSSFLINSYEEKRCLFEKYGVDYLVEINFTRDFSTMSAESFLESIIFANKNMKLLHLGYDFAFGANKSGDHDLAKSFSEKNNIEFSIQNEVKNKADIISSTLVRSEIEKGNIAEASKLLGRDFFISRMIKKGEGRGKRIGFPTANITTDKKRIYPGRVFM